MTEASGRRTDDADLERRYRALFENMAEGFVVCEAILDADGRLVDYWIRAANPMFVRRAPEGDRMVGSRQREIRPDTRAAWFSACAAALAGRNVRFEYHDRVAARWYEVHMMRLSDTEFGQFFIDVTERKAAEQRQAELFNELNHRVKNNLAVVSAILELQARASPPAVREQLAKAVDRIRSIGDLHAMLHQQNSHELVEASAYLQGLCARLTESLFEDGRARIEAESAAVSLPVRDAVSLGLIVNELVTNAAKHAFRDGAGAGDAGLVEVQLAAQDGRLTLRVSDNGAGMGGNGQDGNGGREGLGLRVVRSLAASLGGQVRVGGGADGGTIAEVTLPLDPAPGAGAQGRLL